VDTPPIFLNTTFVYISNLEGGYDVTHTSIIGNTTLIGMIQTFSGGGTLTIKNFILQN
jgi:hypothetical protein